MAGNRGEQAREEVFFTIYFLKINKYCKKVQILEAKVFLIVIMLLVAREDCTMLCYIKNGCILFFFFYIMF